MQVSYSVKEHINLGNYEWVEIGAEVTLDVERYHDTDAVAHVAREELDRLLAADRRRYRALTAEDDSMIHEHPALKETT
jgi:hypothetical protein